MKEVVASIQWWIAAACIVSLLAMLLGCLLYRFRTHIDGLLRWVRTHPLQSAFLAPCVCVAVLYGGSKPDPVTPTVKGITLGSPMETPTQVELAWQPDDGTVIGTNQLVRVYWRDSASPNWQLACEGYGITNAVVSGFFINRDTDWQVVISPPIIDFTDEEIQNILGD